MNREDFLDLIATRRIMDAADIPDVPRMVMCPSPHRMKEFIETLGGRYAPEDDGTQTIRGLKFILAEEIDDDGDEETNPAR